MSRLLPYSHKVADLKLVATVQAHLVVLRFPFAHSTEATEESNRPKKAASEESFARTKALGFCC